MARVGIVNNPRSRRNLRRPQTGAGLRRLLGSDGAFADVSTEEELRQALADFRRLGVELLAANGGDGTLGRLVTALPDAWGPPPWPPLLPLPGGSMNNVARAHGHRGSPERVLKRTLERIRSGKPVAARERDLLHVAAPGGPSQLGFLFATGAAVHFLDRWNGRRSGPLRALSLLALLMGSALVGGRAAAAIGQRESLRVVADGDEWPAREWLSVLAGSVPGLGLGSRFFSRCQEQPGFFHAVGVTASPRRLLLALPALWRGRSFRRQVALDAVAKELLIEPRRPLRFTLDGDLFEAAGPLRVVAGPVVEIVLDAGQASLHRLPGDGLTTREFAR